MRPVPPEGEDTRTEAQKEEDRLQSEKYFLVRGRVRGMTSNLDRIMAMGPDRFLDPVRTGEKDETRSGGGPCAPCRRPNTFSRRLCDRSKGRPGKSFYNFKHNSFSHLGGSCT